MRWSLPLVAILLVSSSPAFADIKSDCQAHKDYDVRIKSCSEIIHSEPNNAVAYHNRAIAYQAKGDITHALADCDKAIQLSPNYISAYDSRGLIYATTGDYVRALADVTRASELTSKAKTAPVPKTSQQAPSKARRVASMHAPREKDLCDDASDEYPKWDLRYESPR
jgi:tetratricopeptide (TPR) repeat protein